MSQERFLEDIRTIRQHMRAEPDEDGVIIPAALAYCDPERCGASTVPREILHNAGRLSRRTIRRIARLCALEDARQARWERRQSPQPPCHAEKVDPPFLRESEKR
jgi:hypothetical protein